MIISDAYIAGHDLGALRREDSDIDVRWDFADAAKLGKDYYAEFRRGFDDGFDGKAPEGDT